MTQRFEYQDGKSHKFWEIKVEGNSHTVRYGKVGTDGRLSTKEFGSPEEAQKSADKLIAQKTKKGYAAAGTQATSGSAQSPKKTEAKASKPTQSKAAASTKPIPQTSPPLLPAGPGEWRTLAAPGKALAVHSNGLAIITHTFDKTWSVLDENGTVLHNVEGDYLSAAAFSPDGSRIAVADNGGEQVSIHDAQTFERIAKRRMLALELIYDLTGERIAVSGENNIALCCAETLGYQHYLKQGRPQNTRFEEGHILSGGSGYSIMPDPGVSDVLPKRPKAVRLEDTKYRGEGGFAIDGDRVIGVMASLDRNTKKKLKGEREVHLFTSLGSSVARVLRSDEQDRDLAFRRLGESEPFTEGTFGHPFHWAMSADGTRLLASGGLEIRLWTQTGASTGATQPSAAPTTDKSGTNAKPASTKPESTKKASPKTAAQPSNPSTGVHRLEFQDGKSHKFWEIKVEGSAHTVCYGKAGTDGRQSTKEFDSPEEAQKSAAKLIAQKTKKGYAPVGGGATPPAAPSVTNASAAAEPPASSEASANIGNVPTSIVSLRPSGTGEWKKLPFSGFALAVRPDGLFITSKAKDRKHWAAVDENGTVVYEEDRNVFAAVFSPDGSRLVVLPEEKERIELYDTTTFEQLKSVRCFAMQVSFDESGSRLGIVQTDKVAILGAETLAYQYVIRSKFAQSIRFQDNKIHIGGDVMQIIDDPGIGEEHAKRPKATKFEGWAINRSDNTFNIESGVVISNSRVIDLQSKIVMRFDGKISRGFSATGRTMYSKRRNTPCTFRRIGETKIIATYPEKPDWSEWYCSVDGTRMVTRFENENEISLWTQTEFPAEASPAPSYQLPDDIPPGFADDFSLAYVVYGTQLEVPFTKLRELANAVFAKEDATWAAVPAGDATKTTGYGPTDTVRIAVGIAIAKAQGGYQGKKSDPSAIKSADIKAAAKAWSSGSEALQQKLTPFGLELGDPETLLVATGPLSLATFQSGKQTTTTEDIVPIELGRSGKLFCTYD